MSRVVGYGLDFGTTNSSVAVAYEDRIDVVELESGSPMAWSMPSLAFLHRPLDRGGRPIEAAGPDAVQRFLVSGAQWTTCQRCDFVEWERGRAHSDCRQFSPAGRCLDSRLIAALKSELANPAFEQTHSWGTDFAPADLVAVVLRALKRRADDVCGEDVRRVVLGYPVAFVGASGPDYEKLQARAEEVLEEAGRFAGFDEVELYPEPAAVALGEAVLDGYVVTVDFGGGTFDVAVIEASDGEGEVVALQGAAVGGELFDAELFEMKIEPLLGFRDSLGEKGLLVPGWFRRHFRTMSGLKHLLGESAVHDVLATLAVHRPDAHAIVDGVLFGGHAYGFYRAVEQAKIALSDSDRSQIVFRRPGIDLSIPLERRELDAVVGPYMDTVEKQIVKALDDAGVDPTDVVAVLRTGGSSRLRLFVERLDDMFGPEKVRTRPAFTSVAHGLAVAAQAFWG